MRDDVGRKLAMAGRVHTFVRANPPADPGHLAATTLFEARLASAGALRDRQSDGQLTAKATRAKRRDLRRVLDQQYLRHLVTVAGVAAKNDPDRFGRFTRPAADLSYPVFAGKVRSMLDQAKEAADVLKPLGLGDTALADLEKVLAEFDEVARAASANRALHVAATGELARVSAEVMESVGVLDGIYRYLFRNDSERLTQWANVRGIQRAPRTKPASPPAPEGGADRAA